MTVGEFKKMLEGWPDDFELTFSGQLEVSRLKKRGDNLVDVEFNQTVYKDQNGKWCVIDNQ
jgi:hypothetical protein